MKKVFSLSLVAVSLTSFFILTTISTAQEMNAPQLRALFTPLPDRAGSEKNKITNDKVTLGKKLFFETKLSKAQDLSCNSRHNLKTYGVDNQPTSTGHKGQKGDRNSPTVYNAALHFLQFWDGRAADVEEQALGPIQNPVEMAMEPGGAEVLARLKADPLYPPLFKAAYPNEADPITFNNIGLAIGAFERTLLTPSRFDAFLKGDDKALTPAELKGLQTFVNVGCISCHSGSALGGMMFQKLGLVKPYTTEDLGRYKVTKNDADKHLFKVPSLRNIEKTGPYFHDGKVPTLPEAVKLMGEHQLGRTLTETQISEIVTFLQSLTGAIPEEFNKGT